MKALIWIKKNVWALIVALVAVLGAGIFWSYHRGKVRSLEAQRAVEKAHREVARIDGQIEVLDEQKVGNQIIIEALREERGDVQREAIELEQTVKDMTDEQIERAFRDLY